MTQFSSFPISSIWLDRANRQRRDLGDLTDLAESIRKVGLLNPVIITREGELVAGERRLSACSSLGWSHITVQFREDLSDLEREQVELDENIRRLDLSWQDRALAMSKYHRLCAELGGASWTREGTADKLGVALPVLERHLRVARALEANDQRIIEAPKFSTALGILERSDARRANVEESLVDDLLRPTVHVEDGAPPSEPAPRLEAQAPIICGNFYEWAGSLTGPPFNLIHCDFPYGINADKHDQGAAHGGYDDAPESYWQLIDTLELAMDNVIAPAAHLMFWFSMLHYTDTKYHLERMGWRVNPTPLIWHKSDNSGIIPDPRRMPRQVYETALLASRGDRFLVGPRSNLFPSPNTKRIHDSEKPIPVLTHFLSMLVDDTTRFLDPTCGSGNSVIVAQQLGAREVLGIELDPEYHAAAVQNWKENVSDD